MKTATQLFPDPDTASDWGPIGTVASELGINRTTLIAAIDRGEITAVATYRGGFRLVHLPSIKAWAMQERKPGPKPQAKESTDRK